MLTLINLLSAELHLQEENSLYYFVCYHWHCTLDFHAVFLNAGPVSVFLLNVVGMYAHSRYPIINLSPVWGF